MRGLDLTSGGSDSVSLQRGRRICISNSFPGGADAAGPGATIGQWLLRAVALTQGCTLELAGQLFCRS